MAPALWPTLADAVAMLDARGIGAALIGGLAVSLRGQPRMTVDIDLVIHADVDEALRLVRDLGETPFEPLFPGVEEVVARSFILPLRHRMTGIRVDLAIGMSGFEREAIARARSVVVGDIRVPVVTVEDLLVMKALAGRPQDELDMRGLVATQGETIDWPACLDLAERLGTAVDLDIAGRLRLIRGDAPRRPT